MGKVMLRREVVMPLPRSRHGSGRRAALLLGVALLLVACPDLPRTAGPTEPDAGIPGDIDGDAFIPLQLDRIVESIGPADGGERVSIYGAGMTPGAKVRFGEVPATNVLVLGPDQLNCNVPSSRTGPGLIDVTVTLLDGQEATLPESYMYRSRLELLTSEPTLGSVRGGDVLTVTGEGFDQTTRVLVGGRLLLGAQRLDEQTITGRVPARLQGRAGFVDVVASNGLEQRTLRGAYRFIDRVRVDWLTPPTGPADGGTLLSIYGSGLDPETTVRVGGVLAQPVVAGRGNSITVRTPPGEHGLADIVVTGAVDTVTLAGAFVYADNGQLPDGLSVGGAWPPIASASGGTQVALSVYGLPNESAAQGLSVTVGGKTASILEVRSDENVVIVSVPSNLPGRATVSVSRDGQTATGELEYVTTRTLDTLTPDSGSAAGDEVVRIRGAGFSDGTTVMFGGLAATSVRVVSSTELDATTPAGVPGLVDVVVDTGNGETPTLLPRAFHYASPAAPRLLAVNPPDGSQAGGRLLRMFGTGFEQLRDSPPALTLEGQPVEAYTIIDDATIHTWSPKTEVGAFTVRLGEDGVLGKAWASYDPTAIYGGTSGGPMTEAINITVLDASTRDPVPEAFVMLWADPYTDFQGVTDERGQVTFSAPGMMQPQMVTAAKDAYTTASLVDFDARNASLLLINLQPAEPGGGPGTGPTPLPGSVLIGEVLGFDKYILPPPGQCSAKELGPPGSLCTPCEQDFECNDSGAKCLPIGDQGLHCTTRCLTDSDCPVADGYVCANLGFGATQCVPRPGDRVARCRTTIPSIFSSQAVGEAETDAQQVFRIETSPGETAIVCVGGYIDPDSGVFTPVRMGVRRHVFGNPGETVANQDVVLDIELADDLRVRLDGAPPDPRVPWTRVNVFMELGSDGVYPMPTSGVGEGLSEYVLSGFPGALSGDLYDASFTFFAGAYTGDPREPLASRTASFVVLREVVTLDQDTVYGIGGLSVDAQGTSIDVDVHSMHGWGGERVWAAGSKGKIIVNDGGYWALQQTPVRVDLRAVWAGSDDYAWAAGDDGAVLRWTGQTWESVPVPQELGDANWRAIYGVGIDLWLAGDAGVWRVEGGERWEQVMSAGGVRRTTVRAIWAATPDQVWLAGDAGLLRVWTRDGVINMDQPGGDLFALHGSTSIDIWAVGEAGRTLRWDGTRWFERLPVTHRTLRSVQGLDSATAWAAGDAGTVLSWDGDSWRVHAEIEHVDLRGVHETGDGRVTAAGLRTIVVGPFLAPAAELTPQILELPGDVRLRWRALGPDASLTYLALKEQGGFGFWTFIVKGGRRDVPLPDLRTAWGLFPLWSPRGSADVIRIYEPDMNLDRFDYTMLNQADWRAWSQVEFPMEYPAPQP